MMQQRSRSRKKGAGPLRRIMGNRRICASWRDTLERRVFVTPGALLLRRMWFGTLFRRLGVAVRPAQEHTRMSFPGVSMTRTHAPPGWPLPQKPRSIPQQSPEPPHKGSTGTTAPTRRMLPDERASAHTYTPAPRGTQFCVEDFTFTPQRKPGPLYQLTVGGGGESQKTAPLSGAALASGRSSNEASAIRIPAERMRTRTVRGAVDGCL